MSWFVVRTKPRQEWVAKSNLENQQFELYLPELVRDSGVKEALFPGYIFIKNQAGPTPFDKIRFTRGILNFVRFGQRLATADESLVQSIREREQLLQGCALYKPNQKVRITEGAFQNIEAIYLTRSGKDRVVLLLSILNTQQKVQMPSASIESV